MAGPYGLQSTGFVVKPLADILSDIETAELALISASLDIQPTSPIGVINGIVAQALADLWDLASAMYSGMDPDTATGDQLEGLSLITGTVRDPATATVVVDCTVNVNAGFNALPGTMFASVVGSPEHLFYNLEEVDNPGGVPADETVSFICEDTGPIQALSGTLTVIAVPLAGWNSVTNPDDGNIGSDIESDSHLRLKRQEELTLGGNTTAEAIRADVIAQMQPTATPPTSVPTTACTVLYNDTNLLDANNLAPHTIEVIARSPGATADDDTLLAQLILNDKAAGDGTQGTSVVVVTDSQGNDQNIKFTRPTDTPLTVVITVLTDPTQPAVDEDTVKQALTDYADATFQPGLDVFILHLASQVFNVPGVIDYSAYTVNGGTSNISIDVRHVATLDSSDITVTIT
jgi:uncharacterized phage protein gp47/JayE